MNTNKILMGLILPAIIGASAAFAQQPTLDKLRFPTTGKGGVYAKAANKEISGTVVIPDTYDGKSVTDIDNNGFYHCTGIKSVTIPASVTKIWDAAFRGCTNLTSVTFQGGNASLRLNNATNSLAGAAFDGDLGSKYQAGGAGTYTRSAGSNSWTKQGDTKICPCCGRPL